jgi:16S rRNA (guanine527-N7)-methyltransferase
VKHPRERLRAYCELLVAEPGAPTAVRTVEAAWAVHVEDALAAVALVQELAGGGPAVDVGSGGGSPGIPLAVELDMPVALLESSVRRCRFLARAVIVAGAPCTIVTARSEEHARGGGRDAYGLAFARALAPPAAAVELVLPLVRPGGAAVLWTGDVDATALERVAAEVGGGVEAVHEPSLGRRFVVLRKHAPTPERYPRRPGMARKRPLASVPSRP